MIEIVVLLMMIMACYKLEDYCICQDLFLLIQLLMQERIARVLHHLLETYFFNHLLDFKIFFIVALPLIISYESTIIQDRTDIYAVGCNTLVYVIHFRCNTLPCSITGWMQYRIDSNMPPKSYILYFSNDLISVL